MVNLNQKLKNQKNEIHKQTKEVIKMVQMWDKYQDKGLQRCPSYRTL